MVTALQRKAMSRVLDLLLLLPARLLVVLEHVLWSGSTRRASRRCCGWHGSPGSMAVCSQPVAGSWTRSGRYATPLCNGCRRLSPALVGSDAASSAFGSGLPAGSISLGRELEAMT